MSSEADAAALSAGQVLKERYTIERELGRGGFGAVYLARDQQLLSKLVVVKVLLGEASKDSWTQRKFQQELEALARIDHPGVVGILDVGQTPSGQAFLVMQFVEGVTLRSVIQSGGIDLPRAAHILRQIGRALDAAHEKGVVHRDLKPENVMLLSPAKGEEHVKLIDFGIAAVKHSQVEGNLESTRIAGTYAYMAPEQLMGKPVPASDVYSFGVIAFELLTGQRPETVPEGIKPPPRELRPSLPEAAERAIVKALAFYVEERYTSPRAFGDDLADALTGVSAATVVAPRPTPAASKPGQSPSQPHSQAVVGQPPSQPPSQIPSLEMAYVLFTDLVGYSLLPMDRQAEIIQSLQEIVRSTAEFQRAQASEQLICLPTGDGMALVFFQNPVAAVQCAMEIARTLRNHPELQLRMGVHTGPVHRIADINTNRNVSGGGINLAQRVMDCGDAGHILVSKAVADILSQLSSWSQCLHDLGEHEIKHGVKVHLVNFHTTEVGNPEIPQKLRQKVAIPPPVRPPAKSRRGVYMLAGSALTLVILFFVGTQVANWWRASAGGAASRTETAATKQTAPETAVADSSDDSGAAATQQGGAAVPAGQGTGSGAPQSQIATGPSGTSTSTSTLAERATTGQSLQPAASGSLKKSLVSSGQSGVLETAKQLAQVQGAQQREVSPGSVASTAATSTASSQPATPGASEGELEALEDRLLKLSARANATKAGVDRLRQQQARMGVGLRADMATALERQEYLLGQAEAAFNAGDATRAKRQLDLAEREVEKLERFLGM